MIFEFVGITKLDSHSIISYQVKYHEVDIRFR